MEYVPGTQLPFEKTDNFRQLGGYPAAGGKKVKMGMFYRSGALEKAIQTPHDKALLESLGLRVICDFRSSAERAAEPDPELPGAKRYEISAIVDANGGEVNFDLAALFKMSARQLLEIMQGVEAGYAAMPFGNEAYKAMFREIAAGNAPLLFHCSAGKDRTGVAAALILLALGASEETVMWDYLHTNDCRAETRAALEKEFESKFGTDEETGKMLARMFAGVRPEGMQLALGAIKQRYPRFEDYLLAEYGIGQKELANMRRTYLE